MSDENRARSLVEAGLRSFREGQVRVAIARWDEAIDLDPSCTQARAFVSYVRVNLIRLGAHLRQHPPVDDAPIVLPSSWPRAPEGLLEPPGASPEPPPAARRSPSATFRGQAAALVPPGPGPLPTAPLPTPGSPAVPAPEPAPVELEDPEQYVPLPEAADFAFGAADATADEGPYAKVEIDSGRHGTAPQDDDEDDYAAVEISIEGEGPSEPDDYALPPPPEALDAPEMFLEAPAAEHAPTEPMDYVADRIQSSQLPTYPIERLAGTPAAAGAAAAAPPAPPPAAPARRPSDAPPLLADGVPTTPPATDRMPEPRKTAPPAVQATLERLRGGKAPAATGRPGSLAPQGTMLGIGPEMAAQLAALTQQDPLFRDPTSGVPSPAGGAAAGSGRMPASPTPAAPAPPPRPDDFAREAGSFSEDLPTRARTSEPGPGSGLTRPADFVREPGSFGEDLPTRARLSDAGPGHGASRPDDFAREAGSFSEDLPTRARTTEAIRPLPGPASQDDFVREPGSFSDYLPTRDRTSEAIRPLPGSAPQDDFVREPGSFSEDLPTRLRPVTEGQPFRPVQEYPGDFVREPGSFSEDLPTRLRSTPPPPPPQQAAGAAFSEDSATSVREPGREAVRTREGRDTEEVDALLQPQRGLAFVRRLLELGDVERCYRVSEELQERYPNLPGADTVLAQAEAALERRNLESLGPLDAIPVAQAVNGALREQAIDPRTAFLLSRIDGSLSLEDLLDVSGMSRFETTRLLVHLKSLGLIRLDRRR